MYYGKLEPFENDLVKIEFLNPHSQETFTQFTIKVWNKTDGYILMKKHLIVFDSETYGYSNKSIVKESIAFVEPKGDITRTVKVSGGGGFRVKDITVSFKDVFSSVPVDGQKTKGGEFKMKPDVNSLMMEPFSVSLRRWRYTSKELTADFKIKYRGEGLGIVDESTVKIRREDGSIVENKRDGAKPIVLPPMDATTVTVVKSFKKGELKKGESLYVVWDDALQAATGEGFEVDDIKLVYR